MVKILITGDLCPINRVAELVQANDLNSVYNDFLPVLLENDFNITNLECPLYDGNSRINKSGPSLKVDQDFSKLLKFGNFHLATLANNHIMDSGVDGLNSTIRACKKENISTVGVGENLKDARKPLIKEIKGFKIAILNFAENEFSTTHGNEPGANPINVIINFYDIQSARNEADYVFVIVHGGHEYYNLPSPRMQETYRFFVDAGADAVIGHHTHCYSGYEIYKEKPIFYSIGNFIFDWPGKRNSIWNEGYAVQFILKDNKIDFNIIPFSQCNEKAGVLLLNDMEKNDFNLKLKNLNKIINNSIQLLESFNKYARTNKNEYNTMIQPYSNRYLTALFYRGYIPSIISKKKRRLFLNFIRCEAHRDMLIKILQE
jgi:hypothetical protein